MKTPAKMPVKTDALVFPFDLFGHAGARDGAELLGDALREMLRDNRREKTPTRSRAYTGKVRVDELLLDNLNDYHTWRENAREAIDAALGENFLLWFTGNHLGALPLYDVLDEKTLVVQFDAHLDIYNLADSTPDLSHGNFLRHIDGPRPAIVNLGHREQVLTDAAIGEFYVRAFSSADLHRDLAPAIDFIRGHDRIVIDIDCDVFDPAYFPGIAQPEPFGLSPSLVLRILEEIWSPGVLGVAISEFVPAHDRRDQSLATLLWLVEWILLRVHAKS
jgi:agmatinase